MPSGYAKRQRLSRHKLAGDGICPCLPGGGLRHRP